MDTHERMSPDPGVPEIRLSLLAEPSSVVLAREVVRYALTGWGHDRDGIHDAMLVMSEIVTNAVAAARGRRIRIRCALHQRVPLLECWDPSPALPVARHPSETAESAESGRGLVIIAAYAKDHGIRPSATGTGKVVWALMPT